MRPRAVCLVAARDVREALRSRWFLAAAASFLALSLGVSALGLAGSMRSGMAGYDRTTASVLNLALIFVPLVTLTLGGLGLAGELEDGTLATLLAQPITRAEVYFGKFLGLTVAVWASVLLGFGSTALVVVLTAGGGDAGAFVALTGLVLLLACTTLAIGTLLSALLGSRAKVVGAAFGAWMMLVYGSDLGTIGLVVARHVSPAQLFGLALLNPLQQARLLGTLVLSRRLDVLGPAGVFGVDRFGEAGVSAMLVGALVLSGCAALGAGWLLFRRAPVT